MAANARNAKPSLLIRLQFFAQFNSTPPSASTFHFLGCFSSSSSSSISRHLEAAFLSLRHYFFSYSARLQFISAVNQLNSSTIQVFLAFLQLKYPNSSPFSTHPTAMSIAVSCFAVCFLASAAALRFHDHRHPLALLALHLSLSSAYTLIASVVSVLLPDSATFYVYAASGSLSAAELLCFLLSKFEFEGRRWRFRRFFNDICSGAGNSSDPMLQRLPI